MHSFGIILARINDLMVHLKKDINPFIYQSGFIGSFVPPRFGRYRIKWKVSIGIKGRGGHPSPWRRQLASVFYLKMLR